MAQFARPDSVITAGTWTGAATAIDESTPSDADFVFSQNNPNDTFEVGLSDVTDPGASTGHVLRVRLCRGDADGTTPSSSGTSTNYALALVQGTTVIASVGTTAAPTSWTTVTLNLSGAEADAITDYADLRVRVTASGGGGSAANRRDVAVSWIEVETPDAPTGITGTGAVSFGFATAGSGTVEGPAFTGSGGVSFGASLAGTGTFSPAPITGSGATTFGFSTAGAGDYTPQPIDGTGGVSFTFATAGSGGQAVSGSGGVTFTLAASGAGMAEPPLFAGSGGISFGVATSGSGTYSGSSVVDGSGGVIFGASTAGTGSFTPLGITGSGGVTFGFSTAGGIADSGDADAVEEYVGRRHGSPFGEAHRGPPPGAMVVVRAIPNYGQRPSRFGVRLRHETEDEDEE
jgi:hypothetical protein